MIIKYFFIFAIFLSCTNAIKIRLGGLYFGRTDFFMVPQGVLMAIEDANEFNYTKHFEFEYILLDSDYKEPPDVEAYKMTEKLVNYYNVSAVLCPSYIANDAINEICAKKSIPVISRLSVKELYVKKYRSILKTRLSKQTAIFHLLRFAFRTSGCISGGIIAEGGGSADEQLFLAMKYVYTKVNYKDLRVVYYTTTIPSPMKPIIDFVFDTSANRSCFFIFLNPHNTLRVLREVYYDHRSKNFYRPFFSFLDAYDELLWNRTTKMYYSVFYLISYYPGIYTSQNISNAYLQSLERFIKRHPNNSVTITNKTYTYSLSPRMLMFESYISARYMIKLIDIMTRWNKNVTAPPKPSFIVNAAYDTSFMVEDLLFFRCIEHCFFEVYDGSCFCNAINKLLFISFISNQNGSLVTLSNKDIADSSEVADSQQCNIVIPHLQYLAPFHIKSIAKGPKSFKEKNRMKIKLKASRHAANTVTMSRYNMLTYILVNTNTSNNEIVSSINLQLAIYEPLLICSNELGEVALTFMQGKKFPMLYSYSSEFLLEEPVLKPIGKGWYPNIFNFDSVVADLVFGITNFCKAMEYKKDIYVATDTKLEAQLAVKVLHTVGYAISSKNIFITNKVNKEKVLQILNNGHSLIALSLQKASTEMLLKAGFAARDGLLALSGSPLLLYNYLKKNHLFLNYSSIPKGGEIFFAGQYPNWWGKGSQLFSELIDFVPSQLLTNPLYGQAFTQGMLISFIATGCRKRDDALQMIYAQKTYSFLQLRYGPFSREPCTKKQIDKNTHERSCQCTKGPRNVFVHNLVNWMLQMKDTGDTYSLHIRKCGVEYHPLPVSHFKKYIIIGVCLGLLLLLIICLIIFLLFYFNPNRCAPKNSKVPFAIVFTDIHASSSLWTRIPEVMSTTVDRYHILLRSLIKMYGGYEVKVIIDAFIVAFKNEISAVDFCIALQNVFYDEEWPRSIDESYMALSNEAEDKEAKKEDRDLYVQINTLSPEEYAAQWNGLRVRIGMDYGVGEIRKDSFTRRYDYSGPVYQNAMRIQGVGFGGQILISDSAFKNYTHKNKIPENDCIVNGISFKCLGAQPIKGLDTPIILYQLLPERLSNRLFTSLRLDNEEINETYDDFKDEEDFEDIPLTIRERIERMVAIPFNQAKLANNNINIDQILLTYTIFRAAFSPYDEKEQMKAIKSICAAWHIKYKKLNVPKGDESKRVDTTLYNTVSKSIADQKKSSMRTQGSQGFDPYVQVLLPLALNVTCTSNEKGHPTTVHNTNKSDATLHRENGHSQLEITVPKGGANVSSGKAEKDKLSKRINQKSNFAKGGSHEASNVKDEVNLPMVLPFNE